MTFGFKKKKKGCLCLTSYVITNNVSAPCKTNSFTSDKIQLPSKMFKFASFKMEKIAVLATEQRYQKDKFNSVHFRKGREIIVCWTCSQLTFWKSNQSNSINGSDGSAFHPLLTKDERIYVFTPDLCRYELAAPVSQIKLLLTVEGTHRPKERYDDLQNKCKSGPKALLGVWWGDI